MHVYDHLSNIVVSVYDDERDGDEIETGTLTPTPQHITSVGVIRRQWTPNASTDKQLLDLQSTYNVNTDDTGDYEDKKRKEKSYGSGLYPGRNARKVEVQAGVELSGKGDSESQGKGHKMSQIVEEFGDACDNTKLPSSRVGCGSGFVNGDGYDADIDDGRVSDRSDIIDVEIDDKSTARIETLKTVTRPGSRSRPGSDKSCLSGSSVGSLGSGHTPSIITIQQFTGPQRPRPEQMLYKPYKRKPKGLLSRRRSSDIEVTGREQQDEGSEVEFQIAAPTPENKSNNTPPFMLNENLAWSVEQSAVVDLPDALAHSNEAKDIGIDIAIEDSKQDCDHSKAKSADDVQIEDETGVLDQEDYVIGNIHECNEEIKQIEAQSGAETDTNSDSSSAMDEEVIKAILDGQSEYKKSNTNTPEMKIEVDQEITDEKTDNVNERKVKPELTRQSAFDDGLEETASEDNAVTTVSGENDDVEETKVEIDEHVLQDEGLFK